MLVCSCPQCGRPSPLSLSSALMRCNACGYQGRVPPAVEQSMQGAAAILQTIDARERQLDARQLKAVASTGARRVLALIPMFLVTLPALLWALLGAVAFIPVLDFGMLVFFLLPLAIVLTVEIAALRAMRRSQRALLEACAATPPEVTGGTSACHLCGAPLQGSTEGVVRCSFCSADNVVDSRLLASLGKRSFQRIEQLEDQVRTEAGRLGSAAKAAGLASLGAGCLAPVVTLVLLVATMVITSLIEIAPRADEPYVVMNTSAGECLAKITKGVGTYRISYGGDPADGYIAFENRDNLDGLKVESAAVLSGRRVRVHHLKKEGRVVKVYANPMQGNYARVQLDDGTETRELPQGLCLLPESKP